MFRETKEASVDLITTYKDIPGVTAREIAAIEALKASREKLSFGALVGTEIFPLSNGSYDGFTVKLCALFSKLFGIRFVAQTYEWQDLIEKLEARSIDFTGELTPTEERMRKYLMTLPIAGRMFRIFTLKDSPSIPTEADLEKRTIAFLKDTVQVDTIKKIYKVPFKSVVVADYSEAVQMLKNGEIDGFIGEDIADSVFEKYDFIRSRIIFPMVHSPVSMGTANPELASVISVIDKYIATKEGGDKLIKLYQEGEFAYAKNKLSKLLTEEEKSYIGDLRKRKAAVPVAFEFDNYPVSFYNKKEKEFQGIAKDVLTEINRLLDVKFKVVSTPKTIWAEIFEKMNKGEIPMVAQLLYTKPREKHFIWSEVPYSRSYYAIMSLSDFPNLTSHQVVRHRVGVMRLSGYEDIYNELFPNNQNLKKYDTLEGCLAALEKREVDLLMASEYMLITQTHYHEKPHFKINLRLDTPMNSYFGFNKNEKVLCSIISKTQQFVPTDVIESHWTNRTYDYSKKLAENQRFFMMIFTTMVSSMLITAVILLIKNMKLSLELKSLAGKDVLTNIFNRRYFMELASIQMERTFRTGQKCFIVIYDLDHFKSINDKYGHLAGDKVLKEVTQRVKTVIRPYDLHGRFGGEEFILLMTDIDETSLINVIERLRQNLCKEPVEFENTQIPVSASFGISSATPPIDMSTAIKFADDALYQAKQKGRNRVVFYGEKNVTEMIC